MANLPAGFLEALATKYAVLDRDSKARSGLEEAQTAQVAPNAASQRAVQQAQAGQIQATTAQVAPLAQSQIQTGAANAAEAGARGGYYGALGQGALHDLIGAPEDALRHFGTTVLGLPSDNSSGTGNVIGGAPNAAAAAAPGLGGSTTRVQRSILDTDTGEGGLGLRLSKGTVSVPAKGKGMPGYAKGVTSVPGNAPSPWQSGNEGTPGDFTNSYAASGNVQPLTMGQPTPKQPKGMTTPLAPGYAQGTTSVPGPGQTVTTGSWEGPVAQPVPTSTLASQAGVKRVPRLPLAKGTAKVPGKGSGDSVPAMLEPKEAVLNKDAADIMGRGLIGVLNALGNAKAGTKPAPATKGMP